MADSNPVSELESSKRQRAARMDALPGLQQAVISAAAKRDQLSAVLDEHEGDALIGRIEEKRLASSRGRHDEAVIEHRKAAATLRQAEHEIAQLDNVIARLAPEAVKVRVAEYRERHAELARELQAALLVAERVNEALRQNFVRAQDEFPFRPQRGNGLRPYPEAAGLADLSWFELRHNPHATHGGRLGAWRAQLDAFLNPPPAPEPRLRRHAVAEPRKERSGPWYPLPAGEVS